MMLQDQREFEMSVAQTIASRETELLNRIQVKYVLCKFGIASLDHAQSGLDTMISLPSTRHNCKPFKLNGKTLVSNTY